VDFDAKHLDVRANGNVPQVKFLKPNLRSLLRSYLKERRHQGDGECQALFLSNRGPTDERKRCESLRPRLKGGSGDTHNGFRSTAVPLSGGFRPAGQTACPAFDGYLPEESSNLRSGLAVDVGLLNDGEQES